MKTLTLIIKQKFFDQIIDGTKKAETREIRAKTAHKYICYEDAEGDIYQKNTDVPEGIEVDVVPVKYDALQLYVGYNKGRASALVEVKSADIVIITNEDGEAVEYEYDGRTYLMAEIDYQLGNIIDKNI